MDRSCHRARPGPVADEAGTSEGEYISVADGRGRASAEDSLRGPQVGLHFAEGFGARPESRAIGEGTRLEDGSTGTPALSSRTALAIALQSVREGRAGPASSMKRRLGWGPR